MIPMYPKWHISALHDALRKKDRRDIWRACAQHCRHHQGVKKCHWQRGTYQLYSFRVSVTFAEIARGSVDTLRAEVLSCQFMTPLMVQSKCSVLPWHQYYKLTVPNERRTLMKRHLSCCQWLNFQCNHYECTAQCQSVTFIWKVTSRGGGWIFRLGLNPQPPHLWLRPDEHIFSKVDKQTLNTRLSPGGGGICIQGWISSS